MRRAAVLGAIAVLALILVPLVSLVGWWWAGSERADLAQWIMAGASIATLLAAATAAVFAAWAFNQEYRRDLRLSDTLRAGQAAQVAAWFGEKTKTDTLSSGGGGTSSRRSPIRAPPT